MADTLHLERRQGVYHYRRRVPDDLVSVIGKKTIKESLKTKSIAKARKTRNLLDVKWDDEFEQARRALEAVGGASFHGCTKGKQSSALTEADVIARVGEYVQRELNRFENELLESPIVSKRQQAELGEEMTMLEDVLTEPEHGLQDELIGRSYETLIGDETLDDLKVEKAAEIVRRGLLEIARCELKMISNDFSRGRVDHLFAAHDRRPTATLAEVARESEEEEVEKAELNNRDARWIAKIRTHTRFMIEYFGDTVHVSEIDYGRAKSFQRDIARLPKNKAQKYPDLTIAEAIDAAIEDRAPTLSATTQRRYIDFFKKTMELAVAKGLITTNPAANLAPLVQSTVPASKRRKPFSPAQIAQAFSSSFYKQWVFAEGKSNRRSNPAWRFWLPLLLAYGGFRPGEACQLRTTDIKQTAYGTWYAEIIETSDEDDDEISTSLKTVHSRRNVPIHPTLMAVGFGQYVEKRATDTDDPKLFADLKVGKYGSYSEYACRRFREAFLPKMMAIEPGQSVYSFRHSFRDALRRIQAPGDVVSALGGWSEGNKVSDNYGDKFDPDYLKPYMNAIEYPGVTPDFHYFNSAAKSEG